MLSYAPGETEYGWGLIDTPIDPMLWQVVTLRWQFRVGSWVIGQLLRGPEWFAEHRPQVGYKLRLDLEEMGVSGYARVLRIEPCPTIEAGPGRVVLSTFEHSRGELYELTFENVIGTIRVTLAHPIWSEDRQSWVRAAELEPGERLRCIDGVAVVRALLPSDTERVYNIEVDGDHCYRIGERGVLVHNASSDCCDGPSLWEALKTATPQSVDPTAEPSCSTGKTDVVCLLSDGSMFLKLGETDKAGFKSRFNAYRNAQKWLGSNRTVQYRYVCFKCEEGGKPVTPDQIEQRVRDAAKKDGSTPLGVEPWDNEKPNSRLWWKGKGTPRARDADTAKKGWA